MRGGDFEPTAEPYAALCFGCPAAARLCPRPAVERPRREPARRLRLRLARQPARAPRETLGRAVAPPPGRPPAGLAARLDAAAATTATSEKTFARADGSLPRFCLGLNLEPDAGAAAPNGVLIELTEAELDRLDLREMRYQRVDVTDQIETASRRTASTASSPTTRGPST